MKLKNVVPEIEKKINPSKGLLECKETTFMQEKLKLGNL